jgi:RNA polymerase sigma-70 factor (ECF subfamily)
MGPEGRDMGMVTMEGPRGVLNPSSKSLAGEEESNWNDTRFEALFLKYYRRVVGVLYRLLGDRASAEELANDVFWKLYRQPWWAQSDGNVGGWLHRTAINLGIDRMRAMARRRQYEEASGGEGAEIHAHGDPLDEVLRAERTRRVRSVLAKLKTAHAQILILRAQGLTYKELADALGLKLGTMGTMLVRAEAAFQKQFRRMYGNEEGL